MILSTVVKRFSLGVMLTLGSAVPTPGLAAEVEAVGPQTPWRAFLVTSEKLSREAGQLRLPTQSRGDKKSEPKPADLSKARTSPMAPPDWINADFDDHCWARYQGDLSDFLGGWGAEVAGPLWPARLCLRTCFGISDPVKATDLKLTFVCIGGAVIYLNGQEVGRGHMPGGEVAPLTPAEDYPLEAYTSADGKALPTLSPKKRGVGLPEPEADLLPRYQKRMRTITVDLPAKALVKGRNVLAIDLHRAAIAGPLPNNGWSHLGFREIKLTSASGSGVIAYADALKGTHVWSANTVDEVCDTPATNSLIHRSWFWTLYWGRGMPVKGVQQGNPFDPIVPIKVTMPRNGIGSGQVVLSDPDGLRGITATLQPLKGAGGAVLPPSSVQIRYAIQHPGVHYCDGLLEKAPEDARTVPVWLILHAPKDQTPGWYSGSLNLAANGKTFSVAVQVLVTGLALPISPRASA